MIIPPSPCCGVCELDVLSWDPQCDVCFNQIHRACAKTIRCVTGAKDSHVTICSDCQKAER